MLWMLFLLLFPTLLARSLGSQARDNAGAVQTEVYDNEAGDNDDNAHGEEGGDNAYDDIVGDNDNDDESDSENEHREGFYFYYKYQGIRDDDNDDNDHSYVVASNGYDSDNDHRYTNDNDLSNVKSYDVVSHDVIGSHSYDNNADSNTYDNGNDHSDVYSYDSANYDNVHSYASDNVGGYTSDNDKNYFSDNDDGHSSDNDNYHSDVYSYDTANYDNVHSYTSDNVDNYTTGDSDNDDNVHYYYYPDNNDASYASDISFGEDSTKFKDVSEISLEPVYEYYSPWDTLPHKVPSTDDLIDEFAAVFREKHFDDSGRESQYEDIGYQGEEKVEDLGLVEDTYYEGPAEDAVLDLSDLPVIQEDTFQSVISEMIHLTTTDMKALQGKGSGNK